nr:hypothetical protein [Mycobacterium saskatchewanense]
MLGDGDDSRDDSRFVVGEVSCQRINVSGRPARVERRQEDPAFEHELLGVWRECQSRKPALDHVKGKQLLGRTALLFRVG